MIVLNQLQAQRKLRLLKDLVHNYVLQIFLLIQVHNLIKLTNITDYAVNFIMFDQVLLFAIFYALLEPSLLSIFNPLLYFNFLDIFVDNGLVIPLRLFSFFLLLNLKLVLEILTLIMIVKHIFQLSHRHRQICIWVPHLRCRTFNLLQLVQL